MASGQSRSGESPNALRNSAQSVFETIAGPSRAQSASGQLRASWTWPAAVAAPHGADAEDRHEHRHAPDGSCCPPCMEKARAAVPAEERRLRLERLYAQLQLLEMNGRDTVA